MKRGFTLLELIFVIVVLGIVLSIVAEIVARMYSGYIDARTSERLHSKTQTAVQQIANRVSYRIPATAIAKDGANPNDFIALPNSDGTREILEWIGRDYIGFQGQWNGTKGIQEPLYSGFIDIQHPDTNQTMMQTPGTKPQSLANHIGSQTFGDVNLTGAGDRPAIFFKGRWDDSNISLYWAQANTGDQNAVEYAFPVECLPAGCDDSDPRLAYVENFQDGNNTNHDLTVYEQYDLSYSAYALVPDGDELKLYYNYQPWEGEDYTDGDDAVVIDGLETFRFLQDGQVVRIKLCARESIGGENMIICKEKAIL